VLAKGLAPAGKMALTNYFLQSLICVFVFYGFGLGQYAKLLPTELVACTLAIFSVNLVASQLYLTWKKQGPLEWVWRKLSRRISG